MHIFAKGNPNEIANKLINKSKMQNTDTTSIERRDAIRKAYADYLRLMDDIDTLDKARELYIRIERHPVPGYYDVLETILKQRRALEPTIINKVKDYFEKYSTLETLEKYLDGLSGPSAYVFALEKLDRRNFHVTKKITPIV